LNLFLDREGLWTTAGGTGRGVIRSLPTSSGMAPGRAWRRPVDSGLGAWLADRLDDAADPPTAGALALARLTALAIRAADERPVPTPDGEGWRWRAAPGPVLAAEVESAVLACLAAGAVVDAEPETLLRAHLDAVVDARVGAALDGPLPLWPTGRSGRAGAAQWADHVVARSAVNARTVVVLSPPHEDGGADGWTLAPLAVRIDEPTTRLPWVSADPGLFGADPGLWERWAATEIRLLRRAWGTALPDVLDGLLSWIATYRADATQSRLQFDPPTFELGNEDVLPFLDTVALRLQDAGFDVVAPGSLLRAAAVRRRLARRSQGAAGTLRVTGLNLDAEVLVDGERLTAEEFAALAAAKSELVSVRGRWFRISAADTARLAALARRLRRPVTAADLLADESFEGLAIDAADVLPDGLRPARRVLAPPDGVLADLRPYQLAGLEWLTWLEENAVGGVLADDMGLGKTLQVLTRIAADHPGPTLVVCPVTLVDTWAREAARFTPDLRVRAFHGSARGEVATAVADADVVVTTYGLLARDSSLAEVPWHRVVLDEAQAIKNPDTWAARAARALPAAHRLAVTGTPVENHLGDLWSLLAFAQPGLLPRRKQFMQRFASGGPEDVARLRAVVGPFVLRRAKTDPGVLPDLPDRQVIREDCTLTREQVGAYEAVVADMLGELQELRNAAAGRAGAASPGQMKRRAAVLAGISKLKQICVHPALLTESRRALGDRSGKVTRLVDLATQILDEGQAVVVFTQFASFVPDLAAHLRRTLGVEVATLTGADSRQARARTVAAFSAAEGPPVLVASLKAGGTGLTLIRANHVIHLDRWWNPAVEDQASDRVWRIGQHQKVSVHLLVCPGTLEDRIDEALRLKRGLADAVIRSTDAAITELSDAGLAALVALAREEVLQ
jgi:non-specific serine/threonine protein kinase